MIEIRTATTMQNKPTKISRSNMLEFIHYKCICHLGLRFEDISNIPAAPTYGIYISPDHLNSFPLFSGVRVTRSLVVYVMFVDRCLSFCTFSFGQCVVCPF